MKQLELQTTRGYNNRSHTSGHQVVNHLPNTPTSRDKPRCVWLHQPSCGSPSSDHSSLHRATLDRASLLAQEIGPEITTNQSGGISHPLSVERLIGEGGCEQQPKALTS